VVRTLLLQQLLDRLSFQRFVGLRLVVKSLIASPSGPFANGCWQAVPVKVFLKPSIDNWINTAIWHAVDG
jgi:hypothetical protein